MSSGTLQSPVAHSGVGWHRAMCGGTRQHAVQFCQPVFSLNICFLVFLATFFATQFSSPFFSTEHMLFQVWWPHQRPVANDNVLWHTLMSRGTLQGPVAHWDVWWHTATCSSILSACFYTKHFFLVFSKFFAAQFSSPFFY
jgi:hypothetical protein